MIYRYMPNILAGTDPEEELRVRVFLHSYSCQDPVTQHLSNKLELSDPALLSAAHEPEPRCPPSPAYRVFSSGRIRDSDNANTTTQRQTCFCNKHTHRSFHIVFTESLEVNSLCSDLKKKSISF